MTRPEWPDGEHLILLIDAANATERELLDGWLDAADGVPNDRRTDRIAVDLESLTTEAPLAPLLDENPDAVLVPLRVSWAPGELSTAGNRLRDLVLGDPHAANGRAARLASRRHPERARLVVGASATSAELRARLRPTGPDGDPGEELEPFVLRMAAIALDVSERRFAGRRYKVPRAVVDACEHHPAYQAGLTELAEEEARPRAEIADECRANLSEIAATPTPFFIDWSGNLTRRIIGLAYRDVVTDPDAIERVRKVVQDHPTAFLFTHKSHVDGMALIHVLYENDVTTPHQLGGANMAFKGMEGVSRRGGTIFIRRSFSDDRPYKFALRRYLAYLMEKRFPVSWAFEGTRSRTGKLMPPRYGVLKYVIEAAQVSGMSDLQLIPVAINYDFIGEVDEYGRMEAGQPKREESMRWFIDYVRGLRSPMGRVYLDFGEPVVFDGTAHATMDDVDLPEIAFEVARRVNTLAPVTLPSLLCTALLGAAPRAMTYDELSQEMAGLIGWLRAEGVRFAGAFDESDRDATRELADIAFDRGLLERYDKGPSPVFSIRDDQYPVASYYRNGIVHYFVDKAVAEIALLAVADRAAGERVEAFFEEARDLRHILKFEFFHSSTDDFAAKLDAELSRADPEWRTALADPATNVRTMVSGLGPLVAPGTLRSYLEAYWVAADRVAQLDSSATVDVDELVAQALAGAEQRYRQGHLTTRAAIGKQMFRGAHQMLADRGVLEPSPDVGPRRHEVAARLQLLAGLLTELRSLAPSAAGLPLDPV